MALGTAFSTFSGSPSCKTLGTFESPVACETLPVSLLEPVSWSESGTLCSTEEGTCNSYCQLQLTTKNWYGWDVK